jgi:hypothetical protein
MDLPPDWPGAAILSAADLDMDRQIEPFEQSTVDWRAFLSEVNRFQTAGGLAVDGRLGPRTLLTLRRRYGLAGPREDLLIAVGGVEFRASREPSAPPEILAPAGVGSLEKTAASLWNRYGGEILECSQDYDIPIRAALATMMVEAGQAYDPATGLLMIQYEDHVFARLSKTPYREPRYGTQKREWGDLAKAAQIDPETAFDATSGGLGQVMGFNAGLVGYSSARAMFLAFQDSCRAQVRSFFEYCKAARLDDEIGRSDWFHFARGYNGPGKPAFYAQAIMSALAAVDSLRRRGPDFAVC